MSLSSLRPSLLLCLLIACAGACSGADATPPAGLSCSTSRAAADTSEAKSALAEASGGTCVVLTGDSYDGPFAVPPGVVLTASDGARASIASAGADDPAVSLAEGSGLVGVDVTQAAGVGVAVRAANAMIRDVTVRSAQKAALAVRCDDGAACADGTVTLDDVTLTESGIGLWVSGAHVAAKGGRVGDNASESLASGIGVVAQAGAKLEIDGTVVEKNQSVGVLVDGEKTTAAIRNATVSENGERGLWVQRVAGTLDAPAVRVEQTNVVKNRIVGVGGVEARGIIIVGGRVAETVAAPVVTDLSATASVGDGVGIFGGSTDVKIDGTLLEANARAAGVIDGSEQGIIIVGGKVAPGTSGLKFVVQNSTAEVQIADADRSQPDAALAISAPKIALPSVLP